MLEYISEILFFSGIILAVQCTLYCMEISLSLLPSRKKTPSIDDIRPVVAIIVPAHNEESGINDVVSGIRKQLRTGDRLLVVADNCTDKTADIARQAGAEVIERHDTLKRGKGYALDAGRRHLQQDKPPYVIFIDADCFLGDGTIDHLVNKAQATGRAVQGLNLMLAPPGADLKVKVAEFAFLVKNKLRPLGLSRLRLGCHLTGSGMAFPWSLLTSADIANADLVEDMKLGLDLTAKGSPPVFCRYALVYSYFPSSPLGTQTQRQRWETGHLNLISTASKYLFSPAFLLRPRAFLFALDLTIPPLTLLFLVLVAYMAIAAITTLFLGIGLASLILALFCLSLFTLTTFCAWFAHGRSILPPRAIVKVAAYMLGKIPMYAAACFGVRETKWVRTDRSKSPD